MRLTRKRLGFIFIITALLFTFGFLWMVRSSLYPFFLGILLAYLLNPFVVFLEGKGIKRAWALILIYAVIFFLGVIVALKLLPLLIKELESFAGEFPAMMGQAEDLLGGWQMHYQSWSLPPSMREAIDAGLREIGQQGSSFVTGMVQGILNAFPYMIGIAISPVLAFYILYDWREIRHQLLGLLPSAWRAEAVSVCHGVNRVLHGVIRGQIFTSLLVGALITVGLWLLGIRYALLIGLLAGALDVIPYFGALIGALPAVGAAFLYSPMAALKVLVLFVVVHQTESVLIQPKIVGNTVGLHPLSVIFFVFAGEAAGGLVGMLLAVPVAAIGKVLAQHAFKLWLR